MLQAEHQEILSYEYPQWSLARDELVRMVKNKNLERPTANRKKKRKRGMLTSAQGSPASQDAEQE